MLEKTLRTGACLAGMAFGVWLWNTGEDTRLTQYLGETEYEKASYLTLYDVHGNTDIRIPVPFQIGAAFMKLPEIGFDLSTGTETLAGPRFLWSLIHGNLAISWLPSMSTTLLGSDDQHQFLWFSHYSGLYGKLASCSPILQPVNPSTNDSVGPVAGCLSLARTNFCSRLDRAFGYIHYYWSGRSDVG